MSVDFSNSSVEVIEKNAMSISMYYKAASI